jgi:citrate lyase subunit beta/citryl-CoA lyase
MNPTQPKKISSAGNRGEGIRSDCFVTIEIRSSGGITIDLKSKVKTLYENQIIDLCQSVLQQFHIINAVLTIDDSGALPFTIAARIEAAIKKQLNTTDEFLLPVAEQNKYYTKPDRERVTRLYLPGNSPKLMINAGIYGSHGVILDLEDSVSQDSKHEARFMVRNALRSIDFYGAEKMVRINQLPAGLDDLDFCVPHFVNLILIPKCENPEQVVITNRRISQILGCENQVIHLMPIIESAMGVMNAYEIAMASANVVALAIGLEDYTADLGINRTMEGKESLFARCALINAAVAAGKQPIDSVFSDIGDMDALAMVAKESRSLGFTGMGCIHPLQVPVIIENFMPSSEEIEKAKQIFRAFRIAESEGSAVVSLESKMIDAPIVKRALRIIEKAVKSGRLPENWMETNE